MKNKAGFNIVFFVFTAILFLIISCAKSTKTVSPGDLIRADRDFSRLSEEKGMHEAFLAFIADSGLLFRDNSLPLTGKKDLAELFSGRSDTSFTLTWEPEYEFIAASGELGYTWGCYISRQKATGKESYGTYLTVWERQDDGSWKFTADIGTDGLPGKSE